MTALLFLFSFSCIAGLLVLDSYGFQDKAYELAKIQVAFFFGVFVAEVIL